jgi:hypothetical protein
MEATACGAFVPSSVTPMSPHEVASVTVNLFPAASDFGGALGQDFGFATFAGGAGQGFFAALALGLVDAEAEGDAAADWVADGVIDGVEAVVDPSFRFLTSSTVSTTATTASAATAAPMFSASRRLRAALRAASCRLFCHFW